MDDISSTQRIPETPLFLVQDILPDGQKGISLDGKNIIILHVFLTPGIFHRIRDPFIQKLTEGISIRPILTPPKERESNMLVIEIPDDYIQDMYMARDIIKKYISDQLDPSATSPDIEKIIFSSFFKDGIDWRCNLVGERHNETMYEVTYDGAKKEATISVYQKIDLKVIVSDGS